MTAQGEEAVQINLSSDEALVLFEWLSRVNERDDLRFEHPAEQRVLWDLEATLETKLVAPLEPNYDELLQDARDAIVRESGQT